MGFFKNLGKRIADFLTGTPREIPKPTPRVKPNAGPRKLPGDVRRELPAQASPSDYVQKLTELSSKQDKVRNLEATMFNLNLPEDVRKAALDEYFQVTGYWRPEHSGDWSNEEWRRWEQIYESEPEVF